MIKWATEIHPVIIPVFGMLFRVSNGIFESSPIALKTSLGEREKSHLFKMPKIFKIGSRSSEIGPFEISRFVSKILKGKPVSKIKIFEKNLDQGAANFKMTVLHGF